MVNIEKQLGRLESKGFDFDDMILQGSVVLALLDIIDPSEVNDIDAVVNKSGHDFLREELHWRRTYLEDTDSWKLQDRGRNFEVFDRWYDGRRTRSFGEMKGHSHTHVHRLGELTLGCVRKDVRQYKTLRKEKLDLEHLDAIETFTSGNKSYYLECWLAPHANNIERVGEVMSSAVQTAVDTRRQIGRVAALPRRFLDEIGA